MITHEEHNDIHRVNTFYIRQYSININTMHLIYASAVLSAAPRVRNVSIIMCLLLYKCYWEYLIQYVLLNYAPTTTTDLLKA